jgi:3-oxoadipate enol-lactonase
MPFAQLTDVRLRYELTGPESAPVVVFSNSLGTNHRMWDSQIAALTERFRVLRYDTRGHGESSVTPGPYSNEQLGTDVVGLLAALRLDRVYFCGLSMGGMTGMFLGAHAPERLHKIVLCSTAAKIGTRDTWNARIAAVQNGGMKAVAATVLERWLTPGYRDAHPAETNTVLEMLEHANPEGYAACCASVRDTDERQSLGNVKVPALIVAGKHDPAIPLADAKFLAEHIPLADYVELNAAHLSNVEAKEEFNQAVLRFFES